uniref:Uncharacterized protein n=1 Tax=Rhizophora mucronata TaxID=61149 RepID=A0A2P2NF90_RHIMU
MQMIVFLGTKFSLIPVSVMCSALPLLRHLQWGNSLYVQTTHQMSSFNRFPTV